jgi:hypothetical protein
MEMSRSSPLMSPYRVEAAQDTPTQTVNVPLGHIPNLQVLEEVKEVNTMKPLYTLVLCLPAALALIACGCGVAVLWSPAARPADHSTVGRRQSRRSSKQVDQAFL